MDYPRKYIITLRYAVQALFLLLTLFIGYRFYSFVQHFTIPGHPFVERPPSVEAFLPIAGLMSFKFFLFTGIVEPVHPAAFIMFTAAVSLSLLMKKGFCGWICPVGTVSQLVWMAGEKLFGRNFRMEKYSDAVARSIKYLLMSAFLAAIGLIMAPNMILLFFITDYYKVVDVRTMQFFTQMSTLTLWVLVAIGALSLVYKNFWCRYLCPYGALLGLLSRFGPVNVVRTEEKCTHCSACSRNCPGLIDVEQQQAVKSAECFGCLTCVGSCPSKGALEVTVKTGKVRRPFQPLLFPAALVLLFFLIMGIGKVTGNWQTALPYEEYQRLLPALTQQSHDVIETQK